MMSQKITRRSVRRLFSMILLSSLLFSDLGGNVIPTVRAQISAENNSIGSSKDLISNTATISTTYITLTWERSSETAVINGGSLGGGVGAGLQLPTYSDFVWDNGTYTPNTNRNAVPSEYRWASWQQKYGNDIRRLKATFTFPPNLDPSTAEGVLFDPFYTTDLIPINDNLYVYLNGVHIFTGGTNYGALNGGMNGSSQIANESDGWYIPNGIVLTNFQAGQNILDIIVEERARWGGIGYLMVRFGPRTTNVPIPFLDLPIDYSYTNFAEAATGNIGENPGRVNSWFDHSSPNYSTNYNLTRWDESYFDFSNNESQRGLSWYDGHNGIDFSYDRSRPNETILAAANGIVFGVVNNCGACTTGYGNRVWINHENGYATLYGHLASVFLTNGTQITNRFAQPLGVMGSTGRSTATHLHFGVYYDRNGDGNWTENEVVDPYGWFGSGDDYCRATNPVTCGQSQYLWKKPLWDQAGVDNSGATLTSPSSNVQTTIPSGAVTSMVTLELWDVPPIAEPSAQLQSTGYSFWLRVLDWLTEGSNISPALASSSANVSANHFNAPVTVTINFDLLSMSHINVNQLTLQQWDETGQSWIPLATTIDTINNQASAQTTQPGYFDLQGPLGCPADTLELNDDYDSSSGVSTDGSSVNNLFDIAQDEDWFQFETSIGNKYTINTANLSAGVDTLLEVYDTDGVTLLASDDDSGGENASSLTWQAPGSGVYFVRVRQGSDSAYGCDAAYQMSIQVETVPSPLKCVAFSAYVNGYNPNRGIHPSSAVIDQLLDMIVKQGDYNCIMTYGTLAPLDHVFPAAQARGLKVFANIWLEPQAASDVKNQLSIQKGIEAALAFSDTIVRLSCGVEVRNRAVNNGLPVSGAEAVINDCIEQLRTADVVQPITTIETWWNWCNAQSPCQTWGMADNVDWLGVNVYPWWENKFSGLYTCTTAVDAPQFHIDRIQDVQSRYPGKEVVLTEFGWPAGPNGYKETNRFTGEACGIASQSNQDLVLSETLSKLNDAAIQGVAFSAFREPWKRVEGPAGPFWGIMNYVVAPQLGYPGANASVRGTPIYTWLASATAIRYQFEYDDSSDCESPLYTSGELTTVRHQPPPQPVGDYYWHVQAKNSLGNWSAWSECRAVHILPLIPAAPVMVAPPSGLITNDNTPTFIWNPVPYGLTYDIQIDNQSGFTVPIVQAHTGPEQEYTAAPLLDGIYYWRVRAFNVNGEPGPWSFLRKITIDTLAPWPPTPGNPAHNSSVRGTPIFSWLASATARYYQFAYDDNNDCSSPLYESPVLTTLSHRPPLMPVGTFYWCVKAGDVAGNWSPWSASRTITIQPVIPVAPVLISPATGSFTNDTTPAFTWNAVPYGNAYEIWIDDASNFASPLVQSHIGAAGELTYTAANLPTGNPSKTYYWRVRGINLNNEVGAWSAARSFVLDVIAPLAPVLKTPLDHVTVRGTPTYSWLASTTAIRYQFEYDDNSDFSSPVFTSSALGVLAYRPPTQPVGMNYWHVRAQDKAGNWSAWSVARTITIQPTIPLAPVLLSPINGLRTNDTTPTLAWNPVAYGNTYEVQIATNSTFTQNLQVLTMGAGELSITLNPLSVGRFYWRVRAINVNTEAGAWSVYHYFTIYAP